MPLSRSISLLSLLALAFLAGCRHDDKVQPTAGQAKPGNRVTATFYPTPPPSPGTPEVEHGTAPPLVSGPLVRPTQPDSPATQGGAPPQKIGFAAPGYGTHPPFLQKASYEPPPAPDTFRFFQNASISVASASFSQTDEPSVAARTDGSRKAVFYTGNWYAAVSGDGGGTFSYLNPYTTFPATGGGFCCDQRAIYDPGHDLFIWLLQYVTTGGCTPAGRCTGNNIYRIAVANGAAGVLGGAWCYYDFTPQDLGLAAGLQFDYPHVALSRNFVYFSANSYLTSGLSGANWRASSIVRIPLDALRTCGGYTYNFLNTTNYDINLAQGATDTIYFATVLSTSSVRVYSWAESSGTIFWGDHNTTNWNRGGTPCPDADGVDWCSRSGNGGASGVGWANAIQQGNSSRGQPDTPTVGFMWNAQACTNTQTCGWNRPQSYIRVLRFRQRDLSLIDEPDIWNASYAFQFPSVGLNSRGHIGGSMFWGGGRTFYPTLVAFLWDDFTCNPYACGWENYGAVGSSKGNTNWGDYLDTRPHSPSANTWVSTGYSFDGTNVTPQLMWFGRERDTP